MSLTPEQIKLLEAPLNPKHIAKRSKGGTQLSYIEGYHAIEEANRIFGFDGWSHAVNTIQLLDSSHYEKNGKEHYVITYLAKVCVTVDGKTSEDVGTGTADQTNAGDAHEMAVKTAVTDGLKRALRVFGAQFGNSLYDKDMNHDAEAAKFETAHLDLITELSKFTTKEEFDDFVVRNKDLVSSLTETNRGKVNKAYSENIKRVK